MAQMKRTADRAAQAFVAFATKLESDVKSDIDRQLAEAKWAITEAENEICAIDDRWHQHHSLFYSTKAERRASLRNRIIQNETRVHTLMALMRDLKAPEVGYAEQRLNILAIPRVRRMRISRNRILVHTDCLYGKPPYTRSWRRIGRIRLMIRIYVSSGRLRADCVYFNPLHRKRSGFHTPQIGAGGTRGCWGYEVSETIQHAGKRFRLDEIIAMYVRFAECFIGPDYREIWPRVSRSRVPAWYLRSAA